MELVDTERDYAHDLGLVLNVSIITLSLSLSLSLFCILSDSIL